MVGLASIAALLSDNGDSDLIARLKRRDPDAMGDLYDRFGKVTFALIVRMVKNRAVAEDLLAETFMKAWNRAAGFPNDSVSLGLWILSMARNHAIEYLRSGASLEALERPQVFRNFGSGDHALDGLRETGRAFTHLARDERRILELAWFEGLNQSEIAARMQQPASAIKNSLDAAIQKLRSRATLEDIPDFMEGEQSPQSRNRF